MANENQPPHIPQPPPFHAPAYGVNPHPPPQNMPFFPPNMPLFPQHALNHMAPPGPGAPGVGFPYGAPFLPQVPFTFMFPQPGQGPPLLFGPVNNPQAEAGATRSSRTTARDRPNVEVMPNGQLF